MARRLSRKRFLEVAGVGSALVALSACAPKPTEAPTAAPQPTQPPAATQPPAPTATPVPPTATPVPAGPKILRVRLYGDIQNLDPCFRISQNDDVVADCVMEGLVRYGPNSYDLINQLVEEIKQSEDGLTIEFKLKEGVKWHKGYGELTTEDVKYSYERFLDPELKAAYADDWATLDHVEIIDKYRGKIILKEPFAPLWKTTLPIASGSIVCKKYVEEVGIEKFATDIIGTGPYIFTEWMPKQKIVLKRNPEYHGDPPPWDEIHFIPIEDDKAAEIAAEAGEVDFSRISIASIPRFESHPNLKLRKYPSLRYRWIGMNVEHPKLQDIRVRQAIRYAIDVPAILQAAYMGQAEREKTLIPPGLLGYWKDAPVYERDVEKAKALLADAGVTSLDLRFDIQDTTEYRTWAEIAQQNLKEIGINLTINPMDSSSFWQIGAGEQGKEVELFSGNYSMQPDPAWATMWFTCEQVGVWNWQRWCSPEFDELHRKGLVTMDDAEREKIYIEMEKLFDAACHSIWITHGVYAYVHSPKIEPAVTPHGVPQAEFMKPA
ncbi:MAG: ABC transporter substrate-binding protein [Anaerolineae bacterium]